MVHIEVMKKSGNVMKFDQLDLFFGPIDFVGPSEVRHKLTLVHPSVSQVFAESSYETLGLFSLLATNYFVLSCKGWLYFDI